MASGLIGSSSVLNFALNGTPQSGATLSYACPSSGVRYAVVTVSASASIALSSTFAVTAAANAGALSLNGSLPVAGGVMEQSESLNYSVILAPSQGWTATASIGSTISGGSASAFIQASVLEVV